MPEKTYTLTELKKHWDKFSSISGLRILRGGKWIYEFPVKNIRNIDGVRAEAVKLNQVMSFIVYLEKYAK